MRQSGDVRAAVVGHVEWIDSVRVDRVPTAGEVVHGSDWWHGPGGAGAGAAVQLRKLAGDAIFFTALGDDGWGRRAREQLEAMDVSVEVAVRAAPTRRAIALIDGDGERALTVVGERHAPGASDPLRWEYISDADVAYVTAADDAALRIARRARVLVATSRIMPLRGGSGVELDALVGSATDPAEIYRDGELDPPPRLVVRTSGSRGGTFVEGGAPARPFPAAPLDGPVVDRYGAGDSFAAALAYALADGSSDADAVAIAASCGAAVLTGRGPFEGQLTRSDLQEG
jgi:ribokinase